MAPRYRPALAAVLLLFLAACAATTAGPSGAGGSPVAGSPSGAPPAGSSAAAPSASARPIPSLVPPDGRAWLGMNLDWGTDTIAAVTDRLGTTPEVWVQFVRFPLDETGLGHLDGFFAQVAAVGGTGLVTLEPHDGLDAVTEEAAAWLAAVLAAAWEERGVPTLVRFAHEMNGSWYPWGQQPEAYVAAFRLVAEAIHAGAPASAMVWAPNDGAGYPFTGGAFGAADGSPDAAALDTDGDGTLGRTDDPYAPYWPGDDAVDWVGTSSYFWGAAYPWGENEIASEGRFAAQLTGQPTGAHDDEVAVPDFYAIYAEGHDKPMAITETAALYDPSGAGPTEAEVKTAWFTQVFSEATRTSFPRIGLVSWFEWRKEEPEVGTVIDWRLGADPELGRALLDGVPDGWLLTADE
ncbi:MAG TPA: glycosyl hydrolase [Candidatus Limnocylindria bacterium]